VAASLGSRAAGLTLEPSDESINGEGLGELVTTGGRSSRRGSRLLLSDGGGNGSSNRAGAGGRAGDGGSGVTAGDRSSGRSAGLCRGRRTTGAEESRAGDGVVDGGGVGVEKDAGVCGGVELSSDNTLWGLGSGTSYLNVEALRVVLGTVLGTSAVESNDFVAETYLPAARLSGTVTGQVLFWPIILTAAHSPSS